MNLLCDLGWHSPGGMPRWNDGFYFVHCRRCGCDLVRTAYQKWHVPSGYRVVWSAQQPAERPDFDVLPVRAAKPLNGIGRPLTAPKDRPAPAPATAQDPPPPELVAVSAAQPLAEPAVEPLSPVQPAAEPIAASVAAAPVQAEVEARVETPIEPPAALVHPAPPTIPKAPPVPAQPPVSRKAARLPISEVLDRLRADDGREAPAPRRAATALSPPAVPPGWSEEFMKDDPADELQIGPRIPLAGPRRVESELPWASAVDDEREPALVRAWRRSSAMASGFPKRMRALGRRPARPWQVIGGAIGVSALVALVVIIASPPAAPDSRNRSPDPAPALAELPATPVPEIDDAYARPGQAAEVGIVSASVLSCRSAPAKGAQRIRNILQGERVEILRRAGEWVALSHRKSVCWAEARFVVPAVPDRAPLAERGP